MRQRCGEKQEEEVLHDIVGKIYTNVCVCIPTMIHERWTILIVFSVTPENLEVTTYVIYSTE